MNDPTKPSRAKPKREHLAPKVRGRPGRDPRPTPLEQDSHALALKLGRSALGKAVLRYMEGLDAVKPIFMKADDGDGGSAYIPGEDVPDHAIRIRSADSICDRFGLPKRTDIGGENPTVVLLAALTAAAKERTGAE